MKINILRIADNYAVATQIFPDDLAEIIAAGYRVVICNRPDHEELDQPTVDTISAECRKVGISFHHIPISILPIAYEAIQEQRRIIDECDGPVLAYCRSGQRSAIIWQACA
ncbi:MAG: TIGR01244 family sulfur transferase [Woeseiaceae bacterium]|nr:TIGR01244 family sulfur transferase [Woeseiaceae bacterium]